MVEDFNYFDILLFSWVFDYCDFGEVVCILDKFSLFIYYFNVLVNLLVSEVNVKVIELNVVIFNVLNGEQFML